MYLEAFQYTFKNMQSMQDFFLIDRAFAGGVIADAPGVSSILLNVLQFLLSIIGILGIIGLVVSGLLYFFSAGDQKRIALAKRSAVGSVIGIIVALSALLLVTQLTVFFSEGFHTRHISSLQTPVIDTVLGSTAYSAPRLRLELHRI